MSDSGFLSEENEGDVSLHFPTVFLDAEVGAPEPSIEEKVKAESAKLAALQAEILVQQAELAASQSAATQVAPAEPEAVSSSELRGFMQQIASSFGAMQQDNTTRKAEWEEFQQKVNAERVELTATIMDRIGRGTFAVCHNAVVAYCSSFFEKSRPRARPAMPAMGACNATCMHATRMHAQDGQHDICASYLHPALSYLGQP